MADGEHGRAWRVGEFLGLVADRSKPRLQLWSRAWWLQLLYFAVMGLVIALVVLHFG